ncbi:hypothetical protein M569_00537, partial [Genlisea aurea]
EGFPISKIQVSGATLASLLHRSSAAAGDVHGYLFGSAAVSTPNIFSDHSSTAAAATSILVPTITSFFSIPSQFPLPPPTSVADSAALLGWFSARRKTPLRPSLRDSTTAFSLVSSPRNSDLDFPPCIFLLITTPFQDQLIHTHEYKAFQYLGNKFEPKSLSIVNIGPSFRSQYDSFSPGIQFPVMSIEKDSSGQTLASKKRQSKDQDQLNTCAEGFDVGRLGRLMASEGGDAQEVEDLYDGMVAKIDSLCRLVEQTNARVREQESRNESLRRRVQLG